MSRKIYFSIITTDKEMYLVEVPDLGIFTESDTLDGAMEMGRDAIGEIALARMDMNLEIPEPTMDPKKIT